MTSRKGELLLFPRLLYIRTTSCTYGNNNLLRFPSRFEKKLDKITDDHDILIVNRRGNKDVVVMSLKDYNALEETLYLLASKANARKLRLGIEQLKKGNVVKKSLKDL